MKVCFFDIDGTLIASGGAGQKAFARVFRELFGVDEISKNVAFAGRSDRAITLDLLAAHDVEPSPENWQRFHDAYIQALPESLAASEGRVLPGVEALIATLDEADEVEIGLLTGNVIRGAEAKLTHYQLWHHFAFGGFGDTHTSRDEIARSAVEAAGQHMGVSPNGDSRLAVIGDTVHDITCARAIGAYAVAVPTGFTPIEELRAAEPDLAIETLEDSQTLIDWLTE
ncbi:HAD family hydrolase [Aeoliella sp.]|uniref:HAD family hydrolase n=1 Tax=Aeoliella sp. TaxID=2795800 RepID=UPI003CCC09DB